MNGSLFEHVTISNDTINLLNTSRPELLSNVTKGTFSPWFVPCNNPGNLLSARVADLVDLVVYGGIFPVLITYGVISNVINMVVFAHQGLSDRIHLCLFSLALVDTGFLLFLMCGKSYALVSLWDSEAGNYWQQRYNGTVLGSYLAFIITSNAITALIALERCICVVSPFRAKKFFKTKYLTVGIVSMGVYSLVVKNTALSLKYLTVKVTDPITHSSTYISRLTPFYLAHKTVIDVIYSDLLSVTVPALSLVVVIVCTTVTVVKLKMAIAWRQQSSSDTMTSSEKRETAVTRMLVTVCCVYVICMTPSVTRTFVLHRLPGFLISGYLCNTYKVTTALVHILEAFNASANFVIYCKQSSRFRTTLRSLCGKLPPRSFRVSRDGASLQGSGRSAVPVSREFTGLNVARHTLTSALTAETVHM